MADPQSTQPAQSTHSAERRLLYRQLADQYRRAIEHGALRAGDRMPSMRAFMQCHDVSLATATENYRVLEREALIEARPHAGYFVGIHSTISAIVSKFQRYPDALNLGGATASPDLYPTDTLQKTALRALRRRPTLLTLAGHIQGDSDLRAIIARRAFAAGIQIGADDVIMTHGDIEAVNLALHAVTQPGDTVAVESPCFFGLLQALESLSLHALEIPTSPTTGIAVEAFALQNHAGIKAVVAVPNLQNPLGSVMPDAHKAKLVALCVQVDIALIEDDSYCELTDSEQPPRSLKAWDTDGTVIHCTSFNETLAPGMRVGWINGGLASAHRHAEVRAFAAQRAAFAGGARRVSGNQRVRAAFAASACRLRSAHRFPKTRASRHRTAACSSGSSCRARLRRRHFFDAALHEGIRVMPGTVFSNAGRFDHFIRFICPSTDLDLADDAVRKLGRLAARMSNNAA